MAHWKHKPPPESLWDSEISGTLRVRTRRQAAATWGVLTGFPARLLLRECQVGGRATPLIVRAVAALQDTSSVPDTSLPGTQYSPGPGLLRQCGSLLRWLLLAVGAAASAAVAAMGFGLLCYLVLTRTFTPPQSTFIRTLYLDYSQADMVASTAFLPEAQLVDGLIPSTLPPDSRFLPPGQPIDVWLDLILTRGGSGSAGSGGGIVQVVGELQTADGRVVGRSSQPALLRSGSGWSLW